MKYVVFTVAGFGGFLAKVGFPAELAGPGTGVAVEFFGEWVEGLVSAEPLWDPRAERIRS